MRHDMFELLSGLAAGEASASEIAGRLERMGGDVSIPTLYRRLKDALDMGWVEVVGVDSVSGPGRPGQRYRITQAGRSVAEREALRWRALADGWLEPPGRTA